MKTALLAQQFAYFRKTGYLQLVDFPVDFDAIKTIADRASSERDLWRESSFLKKLIMRSFGPLALELTKKHALHIGCDQWIQAPLTAEKLEDLFCFQGCACIFFLSNSEKGVCLDIFDPKTAGPMPDVGYLVLFTIDSAVVIDTSQDPFVSQVRQLGYGFGDRLKNEFHPLIVHK